MSAIDTAATAVRTALQTQLTGQILDHKGHPVPVASSARSQHFPYLILGPVYDRPMVAAPPLQTKVTAEIHAYTGAEWDGPGLAERLIGDVHAFLRDTALDLGAALHCQYSPYKDLSHAFGDARPDVWHGVLRVTFYVNEV